jgi:hypothetical protein
MKITFKHANLPGEWGHLLEVNPYLVYLVMRFIDMMGGSGELTEIFRTDAMQRSYYPQDETKKSVHQYWRGVDLSVRGYSINKVDIVANSLNKLYLYDDNRPGLLTFFKHDMGLGPHLHVQTLAPEALNAHV